ncbi:MAG: ATP-binding cassette domain-containing protein [Nitrospinae bacterium]|nr:ATP-binding cassette domain-containing protein [Nitrospinota bacterium]
MISLKNVSFDSSRGEFRDVNFSLAEGETAVILGPRRSGKTEFLQVCLGLHPYKFGEAFLEGRRLSPSGARSYGHFAGEIGIVTQHITLLDNLTVAANVGLSLSYHKGLGGAEMLKRVAPLLERFGVGHVAEKFPHEITDSEARLAMMARAGVESPKLVVLDEPTAGDLDPAGFMMVMDALSSFNNEGTTLVVATSSPSVALIKYARLYYLVDQMLVPRSAVSEVSDPVASEFFARLKEYRERQSAETSPFYEDFYSDGKNRGRG